MKTKLGILILVLAAAWARAQTNDLTSLLQQGLFEEQANRNLDAAIASYQSLATKFDQDRQLAATAVFRIGECYRMQGKTNEAAAQYQRILKDFSDQTTLATLSRQNLTGMGMPESPMASSAQQRQIELLEKQIALAQQNVAVVEKRFQVGQATQTEVNTAEQQAVQLQITLAGLNANPSAANAATAEESQEIQRIQTMIQNSPDLINAVNGGVTPLGNAAAQGWLKVAAYLLDHGADVNAYYGTALLRATKAGNRAMVELLLSRGADVNKADIANNTALHVAVQNSFPAVVEVLLANRADVNAQTHAGGYTPLFLAAQNDNPKIVAMLLEHKADVNLQNESGRTPLSEAARLGFPEIVKLLLAAAANPNLENKDGRTALSFAAEKNSPEMVKQLLTAKADPNGGKWDAPLLAAIHAKDTNSAELLLQASANPNLLGTVDWDVFKNGTTYHNGSGTETPLYLAVATHQFPMVQLLLKFKADPNDSQTDNRSLLFSAMPDTNVVEALLDAGAKVDARDSLSKTGDNRLLKWTPLLLAVENNFSADLVEILLKHGANPNLRDEAFGSTPLHGILGWGNDRLPNQRVLELLLDYKADPNVRDNSGRTPLDLLKQQLTRNDISAEQKASLTSLADLLRQHGALDKLPDWNSITVSRPGSDFSEAVFQRGTNDWNQFTLLEAIGGFDQNNNRLNNPLAFADLSRIVVVRPNPNGATAKRIEVNLLNVTNGVDCAKDIPLEFGDVVEIPGREHTLAEPAIYLPKDQFWTIFNYLTSRAGEAKLIVAGGQTVQLPLQEFFCQIGEVLTRNVAQSALTSKSDLARVKVIRRDPKTGKSSEWIVDCGDHESSPSPGIPQSSSTFQTRLAGKITMITMNRANNAQPSTDLWLRDGDVIEVPEK